MNYESKVTTVSGELWPYFITGRNEVLAKVIFSQACVKNSVHRGEGCLLQISGGEGVLLQNFGGGLSAPNFRGGVCFKFSGGVSPIFGIRSTFGRYASYWNAFLFLQTFINYASKAEGRWLMFQLH